MPLMHLLPARAACLAVALTCTQAFAAACDAKGVAAKHRITWTPSADGTVRQFRESTDAQGRWTTAFDGLYSRK